MILDTLPNVQCLSTEDKRQLAEELWDELIPDVDNDRDHAIEKLIESRMEAYQADPASAKTWDAVKQRINVLRHA